MLRQKDECINGTKEESLPVQYIERQTKCMQKQNKKGTKNRMAFRKK